MSLRTYFSDRFYKPEYRKWRAAWGGFFTWAMVGATILTVPLYAFATAGGTMDGAWAVLLAGPWGIIATALLALIVGSIAALHRYRTHQKREEEGIAQQARDDRELLSLSGLQSDLTTAIEIQRDRLERLERQIRAKGGDVAGMAIPIPAVRLGKLTVSDDKTDSSPLVGSSWKPTRNAVRGFIIGILVGPGFITLPFYLWAASGVPINGIFGAFLLGPYGFAVIGAIAALTGLFLAYKKYYSALSQMLEEKTNNDFQETKGRYLNTLDTQRVTLSTQQTRERELQKQLEELQPEAKPGVSQQEKARPDVPIPSTRVSTSPMIAHLLPGSLPPKEDKAAPLPQLESTTATPLTTTVIPVLPSVLVPG